MSTALISLLSCLLSVHIFQLLMLQQPCIVPVIGKSQVPLAPSPIYENNRQSAILPSHLGPQYRRRSYQTTWLFCTKTSAEDGYEVVRRQIHQWVAAWIRWRLLSSRPTFWRPNSRCHQKNVENQRKDGVKTLRQTPSFKKPRQQCVRPDSA